MGEPKKTGLYHEHLALKGRMVDFAGWLLPISYGSVLAEHKAVREQAGLFDVSHMGEIFVTGPDARNYLQYLTINDVDRLGIGGGQYSAILNEKGGFIDDLIIYRLGDASYLLCVNASNIEKDYLWLANAARDFDVRVENKSSGYQQLALQGPRSFEILKRLLSSEDQEKISELKYMQIIPLKIVGQEILCARTGYTGELGVELYIPCEKDSEAGAKIWRDLFAKGSDLGLSAVGLGARDSLRLESGYLLYGQDMDESLTPIEAASSGRSYELWRISGKGCP